MGSNARNVKTLLAITNQVDDETVEKTLKFLGYRPEGENFTTRDMETIWDDVEQHLIWNN